MTHRIETSRRRAAWGEDSNGGFYLIRSQCGERGWREGAGLTYWEDSTGHTEGEAYRLAVEWAKGCPSRKREEG